MRQLNQNRATRHTTFQNVNTTLAAPNLVESCNLYDHTGDEFDSGREALTAAFNDLDPALYFTSHLTIVPKLLL